jgi:hypothetical protein
MGEPDPQLADEDPDAPDDIGLDEVMDTHEAAEPHRREHAKADPRPDEDDLERRTNVEREEVGLPPEDIG